MKAFIFVLMLFSVFVSAQEKEENKLCGELNLDSKLSFDETYNFEDDDINLKRKSPFTSALYSAVIPGGGQLYNGDYFKAALFLAVEIGTIAAAVIYDQKGDDKTESFEKYANENWSVERYARWTIENVQYINSNVNVDDYTIFDNNNNVNWSELNRLEGDIGDYYSHRLAPLGDQQYYEMIGKYPQFNVGWSEFGDDPTKSYYYGDPLTSQFLFYAGERGDANDYYNISSTSVTLTIVNHVLSAIEAAWTSSRINKALDVEVKMERIKFEGKSSMHPQVNLSYSF
ncbi:MAG: DUF5683 domain-containing protein [Ignavibacteria bacterium]|jgi:hypothetical protein